MEPLIGILIFIGFVVLVFVLPIRAALKSSDAIQKADQANHRARDLAAKLEQLRERVHELELESRKVSFSPPPPPARAVEKVESKPVAAPVEHFAPPAAAPLSYTAPITSQPPPLPARAVPEPIVESIPPPVAKEQARSAPAVAPVAVQDSRTFEQFLGAKLFAWFGGLALFLGVVFFVKYAFEHNLIPPAVRVTLGFITGAGLLAAGVRVHRNPTYKVLAQTLCATGVLILYGVTFASHALYKFPAFGTATTFMVMTLITTVAFTLAVRLDALVVAILGMLGGFLTPLLVSTGDDRPFALFSYIALLDIGLLAVAKQRRWFFLAALAAAGTLIMQLGWISEFFLRGGYAIGDRTLVPMGILSFFALLFLAGSWWGRRRDADDLFPSWATLGLCGGAMLVAFGFLAQHNITSRPGLLYAFVFLINAVVLAAVALQPRLRIAQGVIAGLTFAHLAVWTNAALTDELLPHALVCYLVFGVMHSAFPSVMQRLSPAVSQRPSLAAWIAPLSLVLMLLPLLKLDGVSFVIWPAILLVNLFIIAFAVVTAAIAPIFVAVVLTLLAAAMWLFKQPVEIAAMWPFLFIVGGFSVVFAASSSWLAKKLLPAGLAARTPNEELATILPAFSSGLPFLLLIMAIARLPITDPSPVFGFGLALAVFLLWLAKLNKQPILSCVSLGAMLALFVAWHGQRFDPLQPLIPFGWYLASGTIFAVWPFVFRSSFSESILPWAAAALSGVGHYMLVYDLIKRAMPNDFMGLVPAVFVVPALLSLRLALRFENTPQRLSQLAWFGGAALFFITLIFPVQFERQWITLGWAMEGAALLWLFNRVPHHGLRYVGVALLAAAFARLALNPAVLTYQPRSGTPILNWHLYTYGIAAAAHFLGGRWLRDPDHRVGEVNVRACLWSMGGILLFLLLNIEIADVFTPPGERFIAFQFSSNFARDMTYSISWALFALGLMMIGFKLRAKGARYAGAGLLVVTLLKLFFHDLASLGSIYRIAALIVVAVIALAASFLYQRFAAQENASGTSDPKI